MGLTQQPRVEPAAPYGGRVILAGRATRVPQAAVTNGIQWTTTVTPIGPLGWASASDLASWRSPKLHGMKGSSLRRVNGHLYVPGLRAALDHTMTTNVTPTKEDAA
jgi:hypothetical protein